MALPMRCHRKNPLKHETWTFVKKKKKKTKIKKKKFKKIKKKKKN